MDRIRWEGARRGYTFYLNVFSFPHSISTTTTTTTINSIDDRTAKMQSTYARSFREGFRGIANISTTTLYSDMLIYLLLLRATYFTSTHKLESSIIVLNVNFCSDTKRNDQTTTKTSTTIYHNLISVWWGSPRIPEGYLQHNIHSFIIFTCR